MKNNKPKVEEGNGMGVVGGIAALAAAAAGAYFLYGSTKGPARRKALKGWMVKMKGEVMEEVEKMQDVSEDVYNAAVEKISEKYKQVQDVDSAELTALVQSLKGHWKDIKKDAEKSLKAATAPKKTRKS